MDQTKTVAECALQLMYAAKESGGNSKAIHAHPDVDDAADSVKETLQVGFFRCIHDLTCLQLLKSLLISR